MHHALFGAKVGYLRSTAFQRGLTRDLDITPARIDMMWAIARARLPQDVLAQRLVVSRSNAGRMARALERLGLVHRERSALDRRRVLVSLTARGLEWLAGELRTRMKWARCCLRNLARKLHIPLPHFTCDVWATRYWFAELASPPPRIVHRGDDPMPWFAYREGPQERRLAA